ncbi:MAG: Sialic acid transporter permease protein SiaT [Pseudomonadota bacterium]
MTEFLIANMAPIMFVSLIIFLMFGYAVSFSLAACGLFFGFVGVELGVIQATFLQSLPLRMFGIMQNDTLLAIPFFTFMGLILERSGMAEDLLDTIGQLFGPIRGGLAYAVIFVGAMLAATTGVVAASVISMGLISLPIMLRYGYDRRIAGGVIAASGTLAQIIPPSLVLIVLADQLGRSVGDLYKGAFIPGFVLTGLYVGYILLISFIKPQWVPALPLEARTIKEANGSSGLRSLSILSIISLAIAVAFAKWLPDTTPTAMKPSWCPCVWVWVLLSLPRSSTKWPRWACCPTWPSASPLCSFHLWHLFSWCWVLFSWALQRLLRVVRWVPLAPWSWPWPASALT